MYIIIIIIISLSFFKILIPAKSITLAISQTSQTDRACDGDGSAELYSQIGAIWSKAVKEYKIITDRALDLGCGVGRSSFELAKYFDKVFQIVI